MLVFERLLNTDREPPVIHMAGRPLRSSNDSLPLPGSVCNPLPDETTLGQTRHLKLQRNITIHADLPCFRGNWPHGAGILRIFVLNRIPAIADATEEENQTLAGCFQNSVDVGFNRICFLLLRSLFPWPPTLP